MTYQAILLDIEGTTTSISFVYDTLFPYVEAHVAAFLEAHWGEVPVQADVSMLRQHARADLLAGDADCPQIPDGTSTASRLACVDNVLWQMKSDRKTTGLELTLACQTENQDVG